jgi:hypothetical protein
MQSPQLQARPLVSAIYYYYYVQDRSVGKWKDRIRNTDYYISQFSHCIYSHTSWPNKEQNFFYTGLICKKARIMELIIEAALLKAMIRNVSPYAS